VTCEYPESPVGTPAPVMVESLPDGSPGRSTLLHAVLPEVVTIERSIRHSSFERIVDEVTADEDEMNPTSIPA